MFEERFLLDLLNEQFIPAIGCTEPIAVAYATAKAKEIIGGDIKKIDISVDRNVFKNAVGVIIPNTNKSGIDIAVALSIIAGKSEYGLEVLKDIKQEDVKKAEIWLKNNKPHIEIKKDISGLYI